jgi:prepilin-type N-terminal cleavage/methylation domain-containing protein
VRTVAKRMRLLKDERGFTLTEILVTTIIMVFVLSALYSVMDMSLRVFSYGNNKVEAVESARVGMEKMEREIRQAYNYDLTSDPKKTYLFLNPVSPTTALTLPAPNADGQVVVSELTFGNELPGAPGAGNGKIECGTPCEYITYKLTNADGTAACAAAPCTLWRVNPPNSAPVVENVALNGLSFTLLRSDGTAPGCEKQVGMVLVEVTVSADHGIGNPGTQTLTTIVDLRNRGFVDNATVCS